MLRNMIHVRHIAVDKCISSVSLIDFDRTASTFVDDLDGEKEAEKREKQMQMHLHEGMRGGCPHFLGKRSN